MEGRPRLGARAKKEKLGSSGRASNQGSLSGIPSAFRSEDLPCSQCRFGNGGARGGSSVNPLAWWPPGQRSVRRSGREKFRCISRRNRLAKGETRFCGQSAPPNRPGWGRLQRAKEKAVFQRKTETRPASPCTNTKQQSIHRLQKPLPSRSARNPDFVSHKILMKDNTIPKFSPQKTDDVLLNVFLETTLGGVDHELDDWSDGITDLLHEEYAG